MQRTARLRLTPQRRVVLEAVRSSRMHPTAAEIYEEVKARRPGTAFGTVYNALHHLVQAGLLVELLFGDRASRFDANVRRHDHLVCVRCGALDDVDFRVPAEEIRRVAAAAGYGVRSHHVEARGICPECAAAESHG